MIKIVYIFLLFNLYGVFSAPIQLSFALPFTVIGFANKTAFFIQDAHGQRFVLKYHPRGPQRAIHDALGAYIGKSIGLYINEVEIFSPDHLFNRLFDSINPIEDFQIAVTTLHICVPGVAVREIKKMNEEICIKRGLRKEKTLYNIIQYPQLGEIVAFDIFTDNTDRHNGNLFFNEETGLFYAIDMDHGFKSAFTLIDTPAEYTFSTVATKTYIFLKKLYKKRGFSEKEIKALKRILYMLQLLVDRYPVQLLYEEWMLLAIKANIAYSIRNQTKIKKYLTYHIDEVKRLIQLLESILPI